jgi:hypothetical protein
MKAHSMSIINSIILILVSAWGYFSSDSPSVTALIPLFFGVAIILCYPGVKNENKIVSHIAVLLTLLILVALLMPLNGAIGRGDSQARNRIILMLLSSGISMVYFVKSFIAARKKKS